MRNLLTKTMFALLFSTSLSFSFVSPYSSSSLSSIIPRRRYSSAITASSCTFTSLLASSSSNVVDDDDDDDTIGRRDFFRNVAISTAIAGGIIGNGISVQGPDPYIPPVSSLKDQVILITGANTGLGLESAKRLAAAGATLILTTRDEKKGQEAIQDVLNYVQKTQNQQQQLTPSSSSSSSPPPTIYALPLDLCNFQSIRNFPKLLENTLPSGMKIDTLMNNAGVMAIPTRELTMDQYERTFQTNHLGPFALTSVVLPFMNLSSTTISTTNQEKKKKKNPRIVNVSSMAYVGGGALTQDGLDLNNLNGQVSYNPWDAYGKSKLENILFTKELQRRLEEKNIPLEVVALHPGAVRTDLARYLIDEKDYVPMKNMDEKVNTMDGLKRLSLAPLYYFTKSVERGATCQIWLSAGQGENVNGKFYQNCKEVNLLPAAMDMDKAKKLWDMSEQMSGFQFNI